MTKSPMRAALELIDSDGCATFTRGRCLDEGSGRTRDSLYGAEKWCDPCIARDALDEEARMAEAWLDAVARREGLTPNEEYGHYAAPEGQTPQGVPVRRSHLLPWSEQRVNRAPNEQRVAKIRRDYDDALAREARKQCAACGHAQFLHCDDHDDPCGCISNPRTPVEDRCQCERFVDPEVAP